MTAKLEWFGGNADAVAMYNLFEELAHTWDDIVDEQLCDEKSVNRAFLIALVDLPKNPFYQSIQKDILPMWITVVSAFATANEYEQSGQNDKLHISHGLRYAAGHIIAYAVHVCVGYEKARLIMPSVWRQIVAEDLDGYVKEHTHDY